MIDLHLHTTASDGAHEPEDVAARACAAGLRVIAIADHDTTAAVPRAAAAASRLGIVCVPALEVTTIWDGRAVHVLGYWIDAGAPSLGALIQRVREARLARAAQIVRRLADAGAPIAFSAQLEDAGSSGRAIARPAIARALVAAGHATSVADAFERLLGEGKPAYVPHAGPSPFEAISRIHAAGGIASLAHPGYSGCDGLIEPLIAAGLDAIEVFHSAHDTSAVARYQAVAARFDVGVTGGSDFHACDDGRGRVMGGIDVPAECLTGMLARLEGVRLRTFAGSESGSAVDFGGPVLA